MTEEKLKPKMTKVAEYIQSLYQKYNDYTHFDYTCGTNGGVYYEKWNIYTPTINHNTFETVDKLVGFIKKMIADENSLYHNHMKNELLKEKERLEERLEETKDELKKLQDNVK